MFFFNKGTLRENCVIGTGTHLENGLKSRKSGAHDSQQHNDYQVGSSFVEILSKRDCPAKTKVGEGVKNKINLIYNQFKILCKASVAL